MRRLVFGMVGVVAVFADTSASPRIVTNGTELQGMSVQGVNMHGQGTRGTSTHGVLREVQPSMATGVRVQGVQVVGGQLFLQAGYLVEVTDK